MDINQAIRDLLIQLPGAKAAVLMGFDGLAVAEATGPEASLPEPLSTWLTEYAQTLVTLRRAKDEVPKAGTPVDVVVHTTVATVILRPVQSAYYLGVVQHLEAPTGRARFYMQALAQALEQELGGPV